MISLAFNKTFLFNQVYLLSVSQTCLEYFLHLIFLFSYLEVYFLKLLAILQGQIPFGKLLIWIFQLSCPFLVLKELTLHLVYIELWYLPYKAIKFVIILSGVCVSSHSWGCTIFTYRGFVFFCMSLFLLAKYVTQQKITQYMFSS